MPTCITYLKQKRENLANKDAQIKLRHTINQTNVRSIMHCNKLVFVTEGGWLTKIASLLSNLPSKFPSPQLQTAKYEEQLGCEQKY